MVFNKARRLWWYAVAIIVAIVTTLNITKGFFALQSYLPQDAADSNKTHHDVYKSKEGRANVVRRFNELLPRIHPLQDANENITEADLLYSSCLDTKCCFGGRKHYISYKSLYGSRKTNNINRSSDESMNIANRKSEFFAVISRNDDDDDDRVVFNETFSKYASDTLGIIQQSHDDALPPIMYIPPIYNPAHCVQDLLFALLPMVYRGDINRIVIGVANHYPKDDYCIDTLNALGWFHHLYEVPRKTCFDKLWVPAFMHYRYPRGLPRGLQVSNNGLYHEENLPVEMIHFFQREMWRGLLNKNDTLTLIIEKEDDKNNNNQGMILLESRRTAKKRMLKDVDEIADMIRQKLPPNVTVYIVDDVGALSVRQQAALYHNATVLVAPHGGSNPNIVFMKPNTTVFEISCNGGSWAREWILDLGISHYPVVADEPACNDHNIKFLGVKPSILADKVIRAFLQIHKHNATS